MSMRGRVLPSSPIICSEISCSRELLPISHPVTVIWPNQLENTSPSRVSAGHQDEDGMTTRSVPAARPYGPTTLLIAKQQKQTLNGSNLSGNKT
jgi:hypothetical protein